MGFKSKILGALKNFGGCMGTPKTDKKEPMKNSELCDDLSTDEEELEVAKEISVNYSKNDGFSEERNIGNQVTLDLLQDELECKWKIEEKEIEESTIPEKSYEDEKEVKINSEEKPKSRAED
ncbi:hypothetical protein REPUB_Repub05bG0088200 [Reevesia pubescens]